MLKTYRVKSWRVRDRESSEAGTEGEDYPQEKRGTGGDTHVEAGYVCRHSSAANPYATKGVRDGTIRSEPLQSQFSYKGPYLSLRVQRTQ